MTLPLRLDCASSRPRTPHEGVLHLIRIAGKARDQPNHNFGSFIPGRYIADQVMGLYLEAVDGFIRSTARDKC